MTLKLEVGKTYVTADGTPVKIVSKDCDPKYPFNGSDSHCFTPDGKYYAGGSTTHDLIRELPEPGPVTTVDFDIQPSPLAQQRAYFLDEMMLALIRGRTTDNPADIADAFLALADARAKR